MQWIKYGIALEVEDEIALVPETAVSVKTKFVIVC